jgi:hypothetical protein
VLVLLLGYACSLYFLVHHVGRKDGEVGVSSTDLIGTYHGVKKEAGILLALESDSHRPYLNAMPKTDSDHLRRWLAGELSTATDPIASAYLEPPPGAPEDTAVPADILDQHCARCHSLSATEGDGIGARVSLKRWPDVASFAYAKALDPISVEILAQSTHAHALSMPVFAAVLAALLLLTRFSRRIRHTVTCAIFLGLLLDLSGMWLGRLHAIFVYGGVVFGGALFGLGLGAAMLLTMLDLWLPYSERTSTTV